MANRFAQTYRVKSYKVPIIVISFEFEYFPKILIRGWYLESIFKNEFESNERCFRLDSHEINAISKVDLKLHHLAQISFKNRESILCYPSEISGKYASNILNAQRIPFPK